MAQPGLKGARAAVAPRGSPGRRRTIPARRDGPTGALHLQEDRACVPEERLALRQEAHARSRAREQADAELVLEAPDPPRERRLRDVQPSRCTTHVPFFRHRDERLELEQRHRLVRTTRPRPSAMQKRYWTRSRVRRSLAP
jgi:hypothetical protein